MGSEPAAKMGYRSHALARTGWGQIAAARSYLENCRLGNCTFGNLLLGNIPLVSCHLGKIFWEST